MYVLLISLLNGKVCMKGRGETLSLSSFLRYRENQKQAKQFYQTLLKEYFVLLTSDDKRSRTPLK